MDKFLVFYLIPFRLRFLLFYCLPYSVEVRYPEYDKRMQIMNNSWPPRFLIFCDNYFISIHRLVAQIVKNNSRLINFDCRRIHHYLEYKREGILVVIINSQSILSHNCWRGQLMANRKSFLLTAAIVFMLFGLGCSSKYSSGERVPATDRIKTTSQSFVCMTDDSLALKLFTIGSRFLTLGDLSKSKFFFKAAINIDSSFCDAMDHLGVVYRREGKLDSAIYYYKKSIAISGDRNMVPHINLAVVYSIQKKADKALEEYRKVVDIAPESGEGYYGVGKILVAQDKLDEGIKYLKKAEKIYKKKKPELVNDPRLFLGFAYFQKGDYRLAKSYLDSIYDEMKDVPIENYLLGLYALYEENNPTGARMYLLKARELGMDLPPKLNKWLDNK